jgi:hypothetical protein
MFTKTPVQASSKEELEKTLKMALQKIAAKQEKELCHYLPAVKGQGYLHHFSLKKLRNQDPAALASMLQEFIIKPAQPKVLAPKQRAPKGSRKKKDTLTFNRSELSSLVELARKAGYQDIVAQLSSHRSLASIKRDLVRAIKDNKVDQELWRAYCDAAANIKP